MANLMKEKLADDAAKAAKVRGVHEILQKMFDQIKGLIAGGEQES